MDSVEVCPALGCPDQEGERLAAPPSVNLPPDLKQLQPHVALAFYLSF